MDEETLQNSFGYVHEGRVYLRAFLHFPERQIGEVKDTEQAALAYFQQRFLLFEQKVRDLIVAIDEAQNKGSFLMKLLHLRGQCGELDALGDFAALHAQLCAKEAEIQELIRQNRARNLEIKRALVREAEAFEGSVEWKTDGDKLREIKSRWLKVGAVDKAYEAETEDRFRQLLDDFFERRRQFYEDRKQLFAQRQKQYEDLLAQATALRQEPNADAVQRRLSELHDAWKVVGKVPHAVQADLWKRFKALKNELTRQARRPRSPTPGPAPTTFAPRQPAGIRTSAPGQSDGRRPFVGPEAQQQNLRIKEQLCQEAEALADVEPRQATEQAKALQTHWKQTGPVPYAQRRELQGRFTAACDRVFELSYLMRMVHARSRFQPPRNEREHLQLQLQVLRDLLRRDQEELVTYENNVSSLTVSQDGQDVHRIFQIKLNNQRRKIQAKQNLLFELEARHRNLG